MAVVTRQLVAAFAGHSGKGHVTIAYEPVGQSAPDAMPRRRTPRKCTAQFVAG